MRPIPTTTTTATLAPTPSLITTAQTFSSTAWHSPIPYLFGGLAAMLGLIAFALMILACSYWKLSGNLHNEEENNNNNNRGGQRKEEGDSENNKETVKLYDDKILVIMAGHDMPTFLATPAVAKSSFSSDQIGNHSDKDVQNRENLEKSEKEVLVDSHVVQVTVTTSPQPQTEEEEETRQQQQRQ